MDLFNVGLTKTIELLRDEGHIIYPEQDKIFKALTYFPIQKTKVVIIGQDPYHGPGEATGLSFSVPKGVKIPLSLKNIFKELNQNPTHGDLECWALQGVLLLNRILTVEHKRPLSHVDLGWQDYTDKIIQLVSEQSKACVFMLWGKKAQEVAPLIDSNKHLILMAAYPSSSSAKDFFGCNHFQKANAFLKVKGIQEIDWRVK